MSDNPYEALPFWRQSSKRQNLRTIRVNAEVLGNIIAKELFDRVKEFGSMRVSNKSYRYSQYGGAEYVQEWSSQQLG